MFIKVKFKIIFSYLIIDFEKQILMPVSRTNNNNYYLSKHFHNCENNFEFDNKESITFF